MFKYTRCRAARKGRKDGRNWKWEIWPFFKTKKPRVPKSNQSEQASYEQELLAAAKTDVGKLVEAWKERDRKLKPYYCQALSAYKAAKDRYKKENSEAAAALKEMETAKQNFEKFELPALHPKWRNFWLFFIAVAEFPLNSTVFLLMGASQTETYIMAAGLCVVIPFIAHFFGQSLRQVQKTKVEKGLIIAMPLIMLFVLGAIAFIRAKYFEEIHQQQILNIKLTPTQLTILFIIINVALFLAAVVVSYEGSHPNRKMFQTAQRRYREAIKRLKKEAGEANEAARELEKTEKQLHKIYQYRRKTHEHYIQKAKLLQESCEYLIAVYRAANLRVRDDYPECFKRDIQIIELPPDLEQLDWECPDAERLTQAKGDVS